ncbi:MAG: hypothetical protein U0414_10240 [Polyangiaceae bacterium]
MLRREWMGAAVTGLLSGAGCRSRASIRPSDPVDPKFVSCAE